MNTPIEKTLSDDLKALQAMAKQLDTLKEDEVYDDKKGCYVSKAESKFYDELEKRFVACVTPSATSRKIQYDDVIDLIYQTA